MSIIEDKVLSRLNAENKAERRLTVLISASKVAEIKRIAKAMSKISGQRVTQTMIIEDAVDALIEECMADPQLEKFLSDSGQREDSQQCPSDDPAGLATEPDEHHSDGPVMTL